MSNSLVSIIIPCYNAESFINTTINSILNQTYKSIEVIIVDDGSIDNSKKEILCFNNEKIKYIYQQNRGVSYARNEGLKYAKGEYVVFFDADDLMPLNFIEKRVYFLETNQQFNACASSIRIINELDIDQNKKFKSITTIDELTAFKETSFSCPSGYLFEKKSIELLRLKFNTKLSSSADKFYLYQFLNHYKIGFIDESPLLYRVHSESMSHQLSNKLIDDQIAYLKLLNNLKLVSKKKINKVNSRINYTIGASYYNLKQYFSSVKYIVKSFYYSPSTLYNLVTLKNK